MKIIAIGGEPGSGKSTLMKEIIKTARFEVNDDTKLVPVLTNGYYIDILGKYDENGYAQGTDRMSMACQPAVIEYLKYKPDKDLWRILFEGDRLFNNSFLEHCNNNYNLKIVYLKTDKQVRQQRYKDRGSEQNETWLAGRETKISNILSNLTLMDKINVFENNTLQDQAKIIEYIINEIINEN